MGTVPASVLSDPTALALLRSQELGRQQRADELMAEVEALREANLALEERRDQLRGQLDRPAPASAVHRGFGALAAQAVARQLGVWTVRATEQRTVVRFCPEPDRPAHMVQLEEGGDGALSASAHDLPAGVRLPLLLELHGRREQMSALVYSLAAEVEAYARRRRQVSDLRARLSPSRCPIWYDPACCNVRIGLTMRTEDSSRAKVTMQLLYHATGWLPYERRVTEAAQLSREERDEVFTASQAFLELPLPEAFAEAFE